MKYIILVIIVSLLFTVIVQGAENNCEQQAKEYQDIHGGYLIFLNSMKSNGAYELCRYCGHWLNLVYTHELGSYYYDTQTNTLIGKTSKDVYDWWVYSTGKESKIWNINNGEHPPFDLIRN